MDRYTVLKQYFGHDAFRPGQEVMINALLSGRDALGVMPTGAGKSMCYQIPALLLPGLTLVISPLISLMKDQVAALRQAGVPAEYLNSSLDYDRQREVFRRTARGEVKLLYVAPERLESEGFLRLMEMVRLSLVAVDEAHCVSQWGQDFRPSYLKIPEFIRSLPQRPPVGAFTATATGVVREDIEKLLELCEPERVVTGFDRPNLYFEVVRPQGRKAYLRDLLALRRDRSGIVYCMTRSAVEKVCEDLLNHGFSATRYHAGLEDEERRKNQEDFVHDRVRIMVATNAFGMGIDKSNVSFVIHYNMPKDLESYYQEAGRAGRDGESAECILLYAASDIYTAKFLIENSNDNENLTEQQRMTIRQRDMARLDSMIGYCNTTRCLRSYILDYFSENSPENCGNCGHCSGGYRDVDITIPAQKILSCVARINRLNSGGIGITQLIRVLRGSHDMQVLTRSLDKLPTYGIMRDTDRQTLRSYVNFLIASGYLDKTEGEYPVLELTEQSKAVLFRGEKVSMRMKPVPEIQTAADGPARAQEDLSDVNEELLERLKGVRLSIAQTTGVPAYVVFSNATLTAMAKMRPESIEEFMRVPGVGETKAKRYGKKFLRAIQTFTEN